jgi:hypothetical protein
MNETTIPEDAATEAPEAGRPPRGATLPTVDASIYPRGGRPASGASVAASSGMVVSFMPGL